MKRFTPVILPVAALALTLPSVASASTKKSQPIVEVDGKKYRVMIKNGAEVFVFNKALRTDFSPTDFDRRRRAVKIATGCEMRDGARHELALAGMLDCTLSNVTSPVAAKTGN
ncbi:hypothetical protein EWE75_14455 [Sphingomonas populi]|uniref:UrcA family protein n=1 Tax=Sphingomonas populi TaxID=2484750 RepID=A0A4Q6Y3A5_9SPHN|nr:hypothetical protein [Sphingomonas populi]RZF63829.1 hypothetical protein EWE75_14455 [Sphingomonas populi]